jgi:hypothetical protein
VSAADRASSIRALLAGTIDYAGLFPPAALGMQPAVENFAAYRHGRHAWALGRFIVPVAKLGEFSNAFAAHSGSGVWKLSALAGNDLEADLAAIALFNEKHGGSAVVDTLELKAGTANAIAVAGKKIAGRYEAFYEIPLSGAPGTAPASPQSSAEFGRGGARPSDELRELLDAIVGVGGRAKIRTGGVTADAFPSPEALAAFLEQCAAARLAFKATAGLHHPLRAAYRLTYEPASPSAVMHGFMNVFLAAAFAHAGAPTNRLVEVLNETAADAFQFVDGGASWRGRHLVPEILQQSHAQFSLSFGSCSFEEPVADLKKLGWL